MALPLATVANPTRQVVPAEALRFEHLMKRHVPADLAGDVKGEWVSLPGLSYK